MIQITTHCVVKRKSEVLLMTIEEIFAVHEQQALQLLI